MRTQVPEINVLLIEDDEGEHAVIRDYLAQVHHSKFNLHWVADFDAGLEAISTGKYDVCLLDCLLGDWDGLEFIREAKKSGSAIPIIFLWESRETDLQAMKEGASDYLVKDEISPSLLERSILYAIERNQREADLRKYRNQLETLVQERTAEAVQARSEAERRAEQLRESEESFRALADSIPQLAWMAHGDGYIFWYNRRWYEYTGTKPEQMEGWGWQSVHDPEMLPRVLDQWKTSISTGEPFDMEFPLRGADGRFHWFLTRVMPLKDSEGRVKRWFGTNTDITERKRAEEALLESEGNRKFAEAVETERRRLFDVLETLPVMICLLTPDHHVAFANRSFRERFGESNGRRCYEHCFGQSEPCGFCESYKVLETGQPHHWEVVGPDGSIIEAYDFPFTDADGSPMILEMDVDVTDRRNLEEELAKHREHLEELVRQRTSQLEAVNAQLQVLIDSAPLEVSLFDAAGRVVYSNPAGLRLHGFSSLDEFRMSLERLEEALEARTPDGELIPFSEWPFTRALRGETVRDFEMELHNHITGRTWTGLLYATPVFDERGEASSVILFNQDITELRKKAEELRRLNRTLRALGKTNQAMMHAEDESHLLEAACRIIVEDCGHPMVWIGFAEEDEEKTVRPVAQAGFAEGYLETIKITWSDTDLGRGPTGTAIRTGAPDVCLHFLTEPRMRLWRENAIKRGYASSIALPLKADGRTFGALTIYSRNQEAFTEAEVKLLSELAADLAYGITVLRLRQAHQESEMKLKESQARLDLALRSAGMGAWSWEIGENRRYLDDQACRLLGIDPATFAGAENEVFRAVHPDDRETVRRVLAHTLEQDAPYETVYRATWPDGSVHHIRARGKLVRDEKGVPVKLNGLLWDVTERKQMVDELRRARDELEERVKERTAKLEKANADLEESQKRFREVLETSPDVAYRRDLQRDAYDYMSPRVYELTGYTAEEMRSMPFNELRSHFHPDDQIRLERELRDLTREKYSLRYRFRCKDGQYKWLSNVIALIRDPSGKPLFRVGSIRDITEIMKAEEALRAYAARLEALNRDLEDFAFIAAHDLQEPLRKIQTFSDRVMIGYATALDDAGQNYLRRLASSADRMRTLIQEMRSYSKLTSDLPSYEKLDLKSIIEKAVSDLEVKVEETGASIQIGEIPPLEADPRLMRILFQNLLENALKYRSENAPVIRISSKRLGDLLQITVEDNGVGFDEKYVDLIFKPFKRLYGRKEYEGTGMGLAICRKIVERHGGSISAKSAPGEGSVFTVALPLEKRVEMPSPWERDLRQRAERAISVDQGKTADISPEKVPRLSMDLSVHRVELEMQNEELRRVESELKALRDKYIDLFNKVPVGYVALKPTGMITDINQTGADMLGLKSRLLEVEIPLSRFVAPHHQERYYGHLNALKKTGARQGCNLEMMDLEGKLFRGLLTSVPEKDKAGQITLIRIAITDITHR